MKKESEYQVKANGIMGRKYAHKTYKLDSPQKTVHDRVIPMLALTNAMKLRQFDLGMSLSVLQRPISDLVFFVENVRPDM